MIHRAAPAMLLLGACGGDTPPPVGEPAVVDLALPPERELDLLFVIDNSASVLHMQQDLQEAFPTLVQQLQIDGELADLHVGVVTSDFGSLVPTGDSNCSDSDLGHLQKGDPDVPNLCTMVDGVFISDVSDGAGGRTLNYTGPIDSAFDCVSSVGSTGCGFEQPLESMRAALVDADGYNAGFLRETAQLAVINIADEDDCSARDPMFFGPESNELGPLDSFRCFEFGIMCNEPDMRTEGAHTGCRPREPATLLQDIQVYVDFLNTLRPGRVSVASIHGAPEPVVVGRRTPTGQTMSRATLVPSCRWGNDPNPMLQYGAHPAIRLEAFSAAFGDRGHPEGLCNNDYIPMITELGTALRDRLVGQPCLRKALPDPTAPVCDLVLAQIGQPPMPLAACDATASNPPCWRLVADPTCGAAPVDLRIDAVGIDPLQGRHVQGSCQVLP